MAKVFLQISPFPTHLLSHRPSPQPTPGRVFPCNCLDPMPRRSRARGMGMAPNPAFLSSLPSASPQILRLPLSGLGCKWYGYFLTVFEFNLIWKNFYRSVSDFGFSVSVTDPYSNTKIYISMMSISITILFGKN